MGARAYAQREWRLLSWWLATYHADAEIVMNQRVGPALTTLPAGTPVAASSQAAYVRNRWTDAIVIYPQMAILVEAKLDPDPGVFSQLIHYLRLLRLDPSFTELNNLPIQLVALVYRDDPQVSIEAPWYGVNWVVYQPPLTDFPPVAQRVSQLTGVPSILPHDWPARLNSWGIQALGVSGSSTGSA
jgi:hypothetical protein